MIIDWRRPHPWMPDESQIKYFRDATAAAGWYIVHIYKGVYCTEAIRRRVF